MTELKSRGVDDLLIALVDGLIGFPEAITTVFPQAQVHHCVVHLVRQSLGYAAWKDRKRIAGELPGDLPRAHRAGRGGRPRGVHRRAVGHTLSRDRRALAPSLAVRPPRVAYPPDLRRLLYTTNAIESLHMQLRKIIKSRGHFPTDEAATKLLYLTLRNILGSGGAATTPGTPPCPTSACCSGVASRTTHKDHADASHTKIPDTSGGLARRSGDFMRHSTA